MAILVKSETPDDDKNFWATTWEAFADAEILYGRAFEIDVAAELLTAKCEKYMTIPEMVDKLLDYRTGADLKHLMRTMPNTCVGFDSLYQQWQEHWWCNPPFDRKLDFIQKARTQQIAGRSGMMLLPYEPLTKWWRKYLSDNVIVYEPDGRYQFYERDGRTKKQGANFGSVLVAFPTQNIGRSIRIPFERGLSGYRRKP